MKFLHVKGGSGLHQAFVILFLLMAFISQVSSWGKNAKKPTSNRNKLDETPSDFVGEFRPDLSRASALRYARSHDIEAMPSFLQV